MTENRNDWLYLDNLDDEEQKIIKKFLESKNYDGDSVTFRAWSIGESALLDGYYSLEALKIVVQIMELLEEYQKRQKEKNNG